MGKQGNRRTDKSRSHTVFSTTSSLFLLLFSLIVAALSITSVRAGEPSSPVPDVGIDQHLNVQVPLELNFRDELGRIVQLGDYLGTKPIILVFAYYQCPMLCPLVLDGVVKSLRVLSFDAGKQFAVVIVSFAPNETPKLAAAQKQQILQPAAVSGRASCWVICSFFAAARFWGSFWAKATTTTPKFLPP